MDLARSICRLGLDYPIHLGQNETTNPVRPVRDPDLDRTGVPVAVASLKANATEML